MSDQPKIWLDMTDAEKGALLLSHYAKGEIIEITAKQSGAWLPWKETSYPSWSDNVAYRVKPPAPKVETDRHYMISREFDDGNRVINICQPYLANITHTYTITDGIVTACDTIIHD